MKFTLPELSYPYNALEPYIDAKTMQIHHTKHHQAYIDKLNAIVAKHPSLQSFTIDQLLQRLPQLEIPEADKTVIRNHGGGHANHMFFWEVMGPKKELNKNLIEKIKKTFGSLEAMKEQFNTNALNQFGSGWSWLVADQEGKLKLYSTPNQDSPLLRGDTPLIGLDVWEHAYYLKYQNRRSDYIQAWWNVCRLI